VGLKRSATLDKGYWQIPFRFRGSSWQAFVRDRAITATRDEAEFIEEIERAVGIGNSQRVNAENGGPCRAEGVIVRGIPAGMVFKFGKSSLVRQLSSRQKRNAAVSGVTSSTLKRNASLAGLGIFLLFWAALAMLPVGYVLGWAAEEDFDFGYIGQLPERVVRIGVRDTYSRIGESHTVK